VRASIEAGYGSRGHYRRRTRGRQLFVQLLQCLAAVPWEPWLL